MQVTKQVVGNSTGKVNMPSFIEPNSQCNVNVSQNLTTLSSTSTQSIVSQSSNIKPQAVSNLKSQHFSPTIRVPGNDNSTVVANLKSLQKNMSIPQAKTNLSLIKSPVLPTVQQKNIFGIASVNTSMSGFSTRTNSPQNDSIQSTDGIYPNNEVGDSYIQTSTSNSSTIGSHILPSQEIISSSITVPSNSSSGNLSDVILRTMPSPPPYSVAISRPWDSVLNSSSLLDLTPSLTDLKPDELEELLPTLELTESPLPDLSDDFLNVGSNISSTEEMKLSNFEKRKFLINPLTGELELQPSDESDHEEMQDVFTGLRSPAALSDDDTCSTSRLDPATDQSDSETRSLDKIPKLKNSRDRGRDSPSLKQEKIKLRLKLEKSEPINPAYKVREIYWCFPELYDFE